MCVCVCVCVCVFNMSLSIHPLLSIHSFLMDTGSVHVLFIVNGAAMNTGALLSLQDNYINAFSYVCVCILTVLSLTLEAPPYCFI